jgi:hypothetical protein
LRKIEAYPRCDSLSAFYGVQHDRNAQVQRRMESES